MRFPGSRYAHIRVSQYSLVVAVVVEHSSTGTARPHNEYEVYRVRFEVERNGLWWRAAHRVVKGVWEIQ